MTIRKDFDYLQIKFHRTWRICFRSLEIACTLSIIILRSQYFTVIISIIDKSLLMYEIIPGYLHVTTNQHASQVSKK